MDLDALKSLLKAKEAEYDVVIKEKETLTARGEITTDANWSELERLKTKEERVKQEMGMLSAQIEAREAQAKYEEQARIGNAQVVWSKRATALALIAAIFTAIGLALTIAWHGH